MKRHLQYLWYVLRHKWFVFLGGLKTGAPIWRLLIHDWSKFSPQEWRGYVDNFYPRPLEKGDPVAVSADNYGFHGEVVGFRSDEGGHVPSIQVRPREGGKPGWFWVREVERLDQQGVAEAFEKAWNHHQKLNKHHWQYWILFSDRADPTAKYRYSLLPMPDKYVREMVADWMGAGRAITGSWEFAHWYVRNRHNMLLHTRTRVYVEQLIEEVTGEPLPVPSPPQPRGENKQVRRVEV